MLSLLAACGGGGGDSGGSGFIPPSNDFDASTAWKNLLAPTAQRTWTVTGQGSDKVNYSLQLSIAAAAATFPLDATPYPVGNLVSSLSSDAGLLGTGLIETFYDPAFSVRGLRNTSNIVSPASTSTTCDQILTATVPPTATKVGTSGPLFTTSIRGSCNPGAAEIGTSVATWSVEFDSFTAAVYFCLNTVERDQSVPQVVTSEKDCVEIDAAGTLKNRARVTLTNNSPSFNLVASN